MTEKKCEVTGCKNPGNPHRVAYRIEGMAEHAIRIICSEHLRNPKGFHVLEK